MSNDRRSGATRPSQPIHLLRETRFMSREELLRELRQSQITGQHAAARPCTTPPRNAGND